MPAVPDAFAPAIKDLLKQAAAIGRRRDRLAGVRSVFETARRRAIPILRSIRLTLDGQPLPIGT